MDSLELKVPADIEGGTARQWYRNSFVFRRYILPAGSSVTGLVVPLAFVYDIGTRATKTVIYVTGVVVAWILLVIYRNLEMKEEERWRKIAEMHEKGARLESQKATERAKRNQQLERALFSLNEIVQKKSNRFATACKDCEDQSISAASIFEKITQPELQINTIISYLALFFKSGQEQMDVEILLLTPNQAAGHFEYFAYYPAKPPVAETSLLLSRGLAGAAFDSNDLEIIEDIEQELKRGKSRYYAFENGRKQGCVACYAIRDTERNCTPFVLSVYLGVPGTLKESEAEYWKPLIFKPLADRLLLEERLRHLKQKALAKLNTDKPDSRQKD